MDIKFTIPDDIIQATVKDAVMRSLQATIQGQVQQQMCKYRGEIEHAVDVHLSKRLTGLEVKGLIDRAVADRIRDLDR